MKNINIGIIGLGTVGCGVVKTLKDYPEITIKKIAVKNLNKKRNIDETPEKLAPTDTPIYLNATSPNNEERNVLAVDKMINGFSIRIPTGDAPLSPMPIIHMIMADKNPKREVAK